MKEKIDIMQFNFSLLIVGNDPKWREKFTTWKYVVVLDGGQYNFLMAPYEQGAGPLDQPGNYAVSLHAQLVQLARLLPAQVLGGGYVQWKAPYQATFTKDKSLGFPVRETDKGLYEAVMELVPVAFSFWENMFASVA